MKRIPSFHAILAILLAVAADADILSDASPFLGNPSPDFDPAGIEPEIAAEESVPAPYSPADSDFGVQQVLGTYDGLPPVRLSLGMNLAYTDNAPGRGGATNDSSWFFSGHLAAYWRPLIACGWFADIGLRQDFFRFDSGDAVDFENFRPHLGIVKSFTDLDDLVFYSRYEYQRLTTGSWSDSDYAAHRIRTGFQKALYLSAHRQLSAGIGSAFDVDANPNRLERNEYSAELNYTCRLSERLSYTLSYEASFWDYDSAREDWGQIAGLELKWQMWDHGSVSTHVFFSNLDSNTPFGGNDVQAWQTGIGFGFNHSF